jgi:hypothetical protein
MYWIQLAQDRVSGGLLLTRLYTFMFHEKTDVSRPDERLSGSQETISIVETGNVMRSRNELICFIAESERDFVYHIK